MWYVIAIKADVVDLAFVFLFDGIVVDAYKKI